MHVKAGGFLNYVKKLLQAAFLHHNGAGAVGSSQSGPEKIFPMHYKECRLVHEKKLCVGRIFTDETLFCGQFEMWENLFWKSLVQ